MLRILSEKEVRLCLSVADAFKASKQAFEHLASKKLVVPSRIMLQVPTSSGQGKDMTLFKPALNSDSLDGSLGLKVVSVRSGNASKGLPTVPASILLVDGWALDLFLMDSSSCQFLCSPC
jgi:ornithine cyclodeaminase